MRVNFQRVVQDSDVIGFLLFLARVPPVAWSFRSDEKLKGGVTESLILVGNYLKVPQSVVISN